MLLGGGAEPARYEFSNVHLSPAGDRLIFANALMRLGKAPVLMLGGGGLEFDGRRKLECDCVRELLVAMGAPKDSMIPLGMNADTHEEALHARVVANSHGWNRILLVTSANHMRRAAAVFRKQGFEVIPAPCNFQSSISTAPESFYICVPRTKGSQNWRLGCTKRRDGGFTDGAGGWIRRDDLGSAHAPCAGFGARRTSSLDCELKTNGTPALATLLLESAERTLPLPRLGTVPWQCAYI